MKNKVRVTIVEQFGENPYYKIQIYDGSTNTWSTIKTYSYELGPNGYRSKVDAEKLTMEFVNRIENDNLKVETIVYETGQESSIPSQN